MVYKTLLISASAQLTALGNAAIRGRQLSVLSTWVKKLCQCRRRPRRTLAWAPACPLQTHKKCTVELLLARLTCMHTHTHTEGETAGDMLPSLNDLFSCRLWSCWLPLSWRSSSAPACRSAPLSSFLEAPPRVARLPVVCRSASQRGWRVMWLLGSPFASPGSKKSGIVVCLWNHTKTQTKRK